MVLTLEEKFVKNLPENLKVQYAELVANLYDKPRALVIAAVARYLSDLKYDVAFRKLLVMPQGLKFYVEIYCEKQNLYVITVTDSNIDWVQERIKDIKQLDSAARVAVALQDWLGWLSGEFDADAIFVVDRDGTVWGFADWQEKRIKELSDAAVKFACEYAGLVKYYEALCQEFNANRSVRQGACDLIANHLTELAAAIGAKDFGWLNGRYFVTEYDEVLSASHKEMEFIRLAMLRNFLELANKVLSMVTPYCLGVLDDGKLSITRDADAELWLSWLDGGLDVGRTAHLRKEYGIIVESLKKAEKAGQISPAREYPSMYFMGQKGQWPPPTIVVPRETLLAMLKIMDSIQNKLDNLRK